MPAENVQQRLSLLATHWSLLEVAHLGGEAEAVAAKHRLLELYGAAAQRYLLGAVRDPEAAADLFQNFACRFLGGALRGANPERGRFRDYLKGVLRHLVTDYHRQQKRRHVSLPDLVADPAEADVGSGEEEGAFAECWRDELLGRAWQALEKRSLANDKPYFAVLRFRADHPDLRSAQLAESCSATLGKPITAAGVRQLLHRAREQFADCLLEEVAATLASPTQEELADELSELRLLEFCRPALEQWEKSEDR